VAFNHFFLMSHCSIRTRFRPAGQLPVLLIALSAFGGAVEAANPVISNFSPNSGRPGTQVVITGSGFSDAGRVEFGDQREAAFVRTSSSQIIAVVPGDGLTGPIRVTPFSGTPGSSVGTFVVAPRIDDFSPKRGSSATTITIDGANFVSGAGNTLVYFGEVASPQVSVTALSQLQARVPAGISNAVLYVGTAAGWATSRVDFVSTTLPVIEEFTPENGLPGKGVSVVINGANFTPVTEVKFNGVASPFTRTADTQLSTTIPGGATSGKITVTGSNGTGTSPVDFIVGPTIANDPPGFPAFNPAAGKPGDFVVIYGNDFTETTNVSFNGVLVGAGNFTMTAQNQVQAKIPTGATTGPVKVLTTNGEGISPINFTIGPLIESLSRTNGPVGADVTVYGAGFVAGATQVRFGTNAATPHSFPANNQFIVKVPTGATNAPISVSTSLGTNTTPYKFLVTTSIPLIDFFTPEAGPSGTQMQIRGANFQNATAVTIGGVAAGFQATADTLILATVPPGVLTGPVRVSNASGTGVSVQTFHAPPWITSVNPMSGIVGSLVTLQGTNFTDVQNVYFGPAPAALSNQTTNSLQATIPLTGRTGPLTLVTPGGAFITSNQFTVLPAILDFQPRLGPVGSSVTITGTSFYNVTNVCSTA
jgi:hypothetical protein